MFILALSVFALGSLAVSAIVRLDENSALILEYADNALYALFLVDFLVCLWRAKPKTRYLVTWGWVDLLSCIPSIAILRLGRSVRAIRILRALRGLRASKLVAELNLQKRAENSVLAAALLATLLTVAASLAILHLESGAGTRNQDAMKPERIPSRPMPAAMRKAATRRGRDDNGSSGGPVAVAMAGTVARLGLVS